MRGILKKCLAVTYLLYCICNSMSFAASTSAFSGDLDGMALPQAIQLLANQAKLNVVVSQKIKGRAHLQLLDSTPRNAFELLLLAHGLVKWQKDNIWFIGTEEDFIARKEAAIKSHTLTMETAPIVSGVWRLRYAKADDLAHILAQEHSSLLSQRGQIRVDKRTNTIFIIDVAQQLHLLRKLIASLDVPIKQLMIEARIESIDTDAEKELGLNLNIFNQPKENQQKNLPNKRLGYGLALLKLANGSLLDIKLSALESSGKAELISSPTLFTANQQPASIEAGEELPYQEVSDSGGTAVVFKKAVLGLQVIPQVLPNKQVLLQLQINQDRPNSKTVLGMPTISTTQINTNVLIKSGQTAVLGGIYERNHEKNLQEVPFISKIPLLGWLFQQTKLKSSRRELLIFVTPKIIT